MTTDSRTAVVLGKGRVAVKAAELLLEEGYEIPFVVPSIESDSDTSFSDWASSQGLNVRRIEHLDELLPMRADVGISAFYHRIFRQRHIDAFGTLVNVHNSLLPRNRGVRPINWALKNSESLHGVSLHLITPGIDEGAILDQEVFPIDSEIDEVRDVYERCLNGAEKLLARALPRLSELAPVDQDESQASYHSALDDELLGDRRYFTRAANSLH